jgi:antagonist of KipI
MIEVLQPGVLTTIQDMGRNGYQAYGIPRSGALDPFLAAIANRLAGNPSHAPLLEFALIGPSLRFQQDCRIAVTGFGCEYQLDGKPVPEFTTVPVHAGSTLTFNRMEGWFGYLAFSGGILVPQVLGSASTYLAGKIGDRLTVQSKFDAGSSHGPCYSLRKGFLQFRGTNILTILPSLHTDQFTFRERRALIQEEYRISIHSNRMGIYLEGTAIHAPQVDRSAPAFAGAIQVPKSGRPIVLGPEGPTTGGYPQIAALSRISWTTLARIQPGRTLRLQWMEIEQARKIWKYRAQILTSREVWTVID